MNVIEPWSQKAMVQYPLALHSVFRKLFRRETLLEKSLRKYLKATATIKSCAEIMFCPTLASLFCGSRQAEGNNQRCRVK